MRITTIFFDVGGTLLCPDMSRLLAPLLARVQPTAEQLAAADRAAKYSCPNGDDAPGLLPLTATNKGHWHIFFETLLADLGCRDLLSELTARAGDSSYWTLVDADAPATLSALKHDHKLAVISNADGRIREVLARAGLAAYFDEIIDSGLVGHEKPDPRIFRAALEATRSTPGESLYVGDIYAIDYLGATAVGMNAILIDPPGVYRGWDVPRIAALRELPDWITRPWFPQQQPRSGG